VIGRTRDFQTNIFTLDILTILPQQPFKYKAPVQFKSWRDPKLFGVWVNGVGVDNAKLREVEFWRYSAVLPE